MLKHLAFLFQLVLLTGLLTMASSTHLYAQEPSTLDSINVQLDSDSVSSVFLKTVHFNNSKLEFLNRLEIPWLILIEIVLLSLFVAWMISHMIYVLITERRTVALVDAEDMKVQRQSQSLSEEMTQDEIVECLCLIEDDKATWTKLNQGETTVPVITKKKQMRHAEDTIQQLRAKLPTDDNIVQIINSYVREVACYKKRVFDCAIGIPIVYLIMCVIASFVKIIAGPIMLVVAIPYLLSCFAPTFVVGKKTLKRDWKNLLFKGLVASLVAMNLGAKTIRTTTYWSNGTETYEDDYSQHGTALVLSLLILVVLATFAVFYGVLVKYFRHYVFYA